jgi:hypothetical protein
VASLVIKWHQAVEGLKETKQAYLDLTTRLDTDWVDSWTELAERADEEGGDSLQIYKVDVEHGKVIWLFLHKLRD